MAGNQPNFDLGKMITDGVKQATDNVKHIEQEAHKAWDNSAVGKSLNKVGSDIQKALTPHEEKNAAQLKQAQKQSDSNKKVHTTTDKKAQFNSADHKTAKALSAANDKPANKKVDSNHKTTSPANKVEAKHQDKVAIAPKQANPLDWAQNALSEVNKFGNEVNKFGNNALKGIGNTLDKAKTNFDQATKNIIKSTGIDNIGKELSKQATTFTANLSKNLDPKQISKNISDTTTNLTHGIEKEVKKQSKQLSENVSDGWQNIVHTFEKDQNIKAASKVVEDSNKYIQTTTKQVSDNISHTIEEMGKDPFYAQNALGNAIKSGWEDLNKTVQDSQTNSTKAMEAVKAAEELLKNKGSTQPKESQSDKPVESAPSHQSKSHSQISKELGSAKKELKKTNDQLAKNPADDSLKKKKEELENTVNTLKKESTEHAIGHTTEKISDIEKKKAELLNELNRLTDKNTNTAEKASSLPATSSDQKPIPEVPPKASKDSTSSDANLQSSSSAIQLDNIATTQTSNTSQVFSKEIKSETNSDKHKEQTNKQTEVYNSTSSAIASATNPGELYSSVPDNARTTSAENIKKSGLLNDAVNTAKIAEIQMQLNHLNRMGDKYQKRLQSQMEEYKTGYEYKKYDSSGIVAGIDTKAGNTSNLPKDTNSNKDQQSSPGNAQDTGRGLPRKDQSPINSTPVEQPQVDPNSTNASKPNQPSNTTGTGGHDATSSSGANGKSGDAQHGSGPTTDGSSSGSTDTSGNTGGVATKPGPEQGNNPSKDAGKGGEGTTSPVPGTTPAGTPTNDKPADPKTPGPGNDKTPGEKPPAGSTQPNPTGSNQPGQVPADKQQTPTDKTQTPTDKQNPTEQKQGNQQPGNQQQTDRPNERQSTPNTQPDYAQQQHHQQQQQQRNQQADASPPPGSNYQQQQQQQSQTPIYARQTQSSPEVVVENKEIRIKITSDQTQIAQGSSISDRPINQALSKTSQADTIYFASVADITKLANAKGTDDADSQARSTLGRNSTTAIDFSPISGLSAGKADKIASSNQMLDSLNTTASLATDKTSPAPSTAKGSDKADIASDVSKLSALPSVKLESGSSDLGSSRIDGSRSEGSKSESSKGEGKFETSRSETSTESFKHHSQSKSHDVGSTKQEGSEGTSRLEKHGQGDHNTSRSNTNEHSMIAKGETGSKAEQSITNSKASKTDGESGTTNSDSTLHSSKSSGEKSSNDAIKSTLNTDSKSANILDSNIDKKLAGKDGKEGVQNGDILPPAFLIAGNAFGGGSDKGLIKKEKKESKAAEEKPSTRRSKYIVKANETLDSIAKERLADNRFAKLILIINRANIIHSQDENGKTIVQLMPGQTIWLPSPLDIIIHRKTFFAEGNVATETQKKNSGNSFAGSKQNGNKLSKESSTKETEIKSFLEFISNVDDVFECEYDDSEPSDEYDNLRAAFGHLGEDGNFSDSEAEYYLNVLNDLSNGSDNDKQPSEVMQKLRNTLSKGNTIQQDTPAQ